MDSHLALPRILKPKSALLSTELVPFHALVADNIATIMTGYMAFPFVTGNNRPCSLSRMITTDLLRGGLVFGGVAVTDCLEMDAITDPLQGGCKVEEGTVRALGAGADVVMVCHMMERQHGVVERVLGAIERGILDFQELEVPGRRVGALKDQFAGIWDDVLWENPHFAEEWEKLKEENRKLSARAYAQSIALIEDLTGLVPLRGEKDASGKQVVLFTPEMDSMKVVDDADEISRTT